MSVFIQVALPAPLMSSLKLITKKKVEFKTAPKVVEDIDEDQWEDSDGDESEFKAENPVDPVMLDQDGEKEGELTEKDKKMAEAAKAASKASKTAQ